MIYWSVIFFVILGDYGRPDGGRRWVRGYTFLPPLPLNKYTPQSPHNQISQIKINYL